ncbi:hypothetical protein IMZ48_04530 [Candidatus Bathyarchaeota archaeon]|nr:hypothetical protein [Candidatus Bathyarchaeota archaeon]
MENLESHDLGAYWRLQHQTASPAGDDDVTRARWRRLGKLHVVSLSLSSVVILLALTVLGLLWKESTIAISGAEEPRAPWVGALTDNWATTIVTVCTTFIRTAIGFQACSATAMLAGIILEMIGVPLFLAPFFSMLRAMHIAPTSLLSAAAFRTKGAFSTFIYVLIVLEVLVTIATQFSSTILVSDFAVGTFADLANSTSVPSWEMTTYIPPVEKWWSVPPPLTWTFAEHSETVEGGETFDDTGPTYRAFLPFDSDAQRSNLNTFDGPALVMDQRVVCARPSLSELEHKKSEDALDYFSGVLGIDPGSYPESRKDAGDDFAGEPTEFNCALGIVGLVGDATGASETSLCLLEFITRLGNISMENPLLDWDEDEPDYGRTTPFLLLDVISQESFFDRDGNSTADTVRGDGPWAVVDNGSGTEALRVTACIANFNAITLGVSIRGSHHQVEPKMPWVEEENRYDTEAVRHQLGASRTPKSHDDRGILSLGPRSKWQQGDYTTKSYNLAGFFADTQAVSMPDSYAREGEASILFSPDSSDNLRAHPSHSAVFQDTLSDTKSPALALQAAFARIHQMAYYNKLSLLQKATVKASVSFFTSALLPARYGGFIAAVALVITHLIIVLVVTVLFLKYTRHSLVGNHWQAVSQVVSDQTLPILEQADGSEDREVKGRAKKQTVDLGRPVMLRRRHDGRIVLSTKGHVPAPAEGG